MTQENLLSFVDTRRGTHRVPLKDICYLEAKDGKIMRIVYVPKNRMQRQCEKWAQQLQQSLFYKFSLPRKRMARTRLDTAKDIMRPGRHGPHYARAADITITTADNSTSLVNLPETSLQQVHGLPGWASYNDQHGTKWINLQRVKKIEQACDLCIDPPRPETPKPAIILTFHGTEEILLCNGGAQTLNWMRSARDQSRRPQKNYGFEIEPPPS